MRGGDKAWGHMGKGQRAERQMWDMERWGCGEEKGVIGVTGPAAERNLGGKGKSGALWKSVGQRWNQNT